MIAARIGISATTVAPARPPRGARREDSGSCVIADTVHNAFYSDFGKNITVGKRVFINSGCKFQDQGGIVIGDDCLIGHDAVIGAASLLTKDVADDSIAVGSPARVIRSLRDQPLPVVRSRWPGRTRLDGLRMVVGRSGGRHCCDSGSVHLPHNGLRPRQRPTPPTGRSCRRPPRSTPTVSTP